MRLSKINYLFDLKGFQIKGRSLLIDKIKKKDTFPK